MKKHNFPPLSPPLDKIMPKPPQPLPAPAMPQCVAELVEVVRSAYLLKFPELCGTRVEERINTAIASVRAYYGAKP